MYLPEKIVTSVSTDSKQREVGYWGKQVFELSNHLGNILATITDKKLQVSLNTSSTAYFEADVQTVQDYYAFGMQMPGRKLSGGYRFGFNGKENDNEVKGEGNQQDYGMRIYDGRIGKFLSVDPSTSDYPELTPYQFASNRPIDGIDFDGLEYMKAGTSVYGLHLFKSNELYVKEDLWVKNIQIHAKVENHEKAFKITNEEKLLDPDAPKELAPYVNLKGKTPSQKRKELFRANKELKQNIRESSGDVVGGSIDFIKFGINLYWNNKDVNEMNAASESISALSKSDQLVKNAALNPTFPLKLNNDQIKTDLVNFIVDGTMPDASSVYRNIISTWGRLIYKNENAINNYKFNFNPIKTDLKEKSWFMSWGKAKTIYFSETKGNPSKDVINANELLKYPVQKPQAIIRKGKN